MRFGQRRRPDAAVASYAGILDGRHLWLSLEDGRTAELRDPATGASFALTGEVTELLALLPADDAAYDVLLGGEPVRAEPPAAGEPTRVPVSPDGLTQLGLEHGETGRLRVTRRAVAPTALLEAVELRGSDVHLTLRPPGDLRPGTHLVLLDADDQQLARLPITAHGGHVEALVGVADLPGGYFGIVRLALGTDADRVRIRRGRSDLADPHRAVLLPELHGRSDGEDDAPVARLRWNPDSLLVLRILDPADDGAVASVTPMAGRA